MHTWPALLMTAACSGTEVGAEWELALGRGANEGVASGSDPEPTAPERGTF